MVRFNQDLTQNEPKHDQQSFYLSDHQILHLIVNEVLNKILIMNEDLIHNLISIRFRQNVNIDLPFMDKILNLLTRITFE